MSVRDRIKAYGYRLSEITRELDKIQADGSWLDDLQRQGTIYQLLREQCEITAPQPFLAYQDVFLAALPRLAPEGFAAVLALVPLAERIHQTPIGNFGALGKDRIPCRAALGREVRGLLDGWQCQAVWLSRSVYLTALIAAWRAAHGRPAPETLLLRAELSDMPIEPNWNSLGEIPECAAWMLELSGTVGEELARPDMWPLIRVPIPARGGPYDWKPFLETRKAFRARAIAQFTAALDADLDTLGIEDAPVPEVDTQAVEWLILRTIGRQTEYGVNKRYFPGKDNRGSIRRRVRDAARHLELHLTRMG